ncbi:hypothetical protein OPT61_g10473 [Boeremia exigua]|uniref:Uncharacterized protein n=1 Tax=Boeremia exigua TaxID=749465 RepID=A0ACC2HQ82_9PLEO|nr:hypothetical protein OPT61_g10473 [Boeremia exigua]
MPPRRIRPKKSAPNPPAKTRHSRKRPISNPTFTPRLTPINLILKPHLAVGVVERQTPAAMPLDVQHALEPVAKVHAVRLRLVRAEVAAYSVGAVVAD